MAIILRTVKGSELTFAEVDGNFQSLFFSSSFDGTNLVLYTTGSTSQSIDLSSISVDTGSLMVTGSILNGTLTFTKGDGSTFNLVYNTGSFTGSFTGDGSGLTGIAADTATTASYVETSQTASYVLGLNVNGPVADAVNAVSSSYALTSSHAQSGDGVFSGSFSGSFEGDGSGLDRVALIDTYTDGYIPRFNSTTNTLESGTIQDDGSTIGIGIGAVSFSKLYVFGNTTTSEIDGITVQAYHNGTSSLGDIKGISSLVSALSTGTLTDAINFESKGIFSNSTITNSFGFKSLAHIGGVKITNAYHIYLEAHTAGVNKYGIYQAGTNDQNFFAGGITGSSFTGSFVGDGSGLTGITVAATASYVDLVAGPNVTINQVGTSFEISSSGGGGGSTDTGSLLTTASAEFAEITFTKGDGSTFQIDSSPRQVIETVKNLESGTLAKGTPVYASGSTGNAIHVYAASASLSSRMPAAYILSQNLTSGQEGTGILSGFANGLDTSTFAEGDILYVAADGGYTNVKPTGSNLIQNLGKVIVSDATNGSIVSSGAGRSNDVPNIQEGYVWIGDSNGVATPAATSSIQNVVSSSYAQSGGDVSISGTPVNNQVAVWTGDGTIEGDSKFTYNTSNLEINNGVHYSRVHPDYFLQLNESADANLILYTKATGTSVGSEIIFGRWNGTIGSESPLITGQLISAQRIMGSYDTANPTNITTGALIEVRAGENWTTSSKGVIYTIDTFANGEFGTNPIERFRIHSDGDIRISGGVTGSSFTGSFVGDGSGLTGISSTAFPFTGDAEITGSLTIKGDGNTSATTNFILKNSDDDVLLEVGEDSANYVEFNDGYFQMAPASTSNTLGTSHNQTIYAGTGIVSTGANSVNRSLVIGSSHDISSTGNIENSIIAGSSNTVNEGANNLIVGTSLDADAANNSWIGGNTGNNITSISDSLIFSTGIIKLTDTMTDCVILGNSSFGVKGDTVFGFGDDLYGSSTSNSEVMMLGFNVQLNNPTSKSIVIGAGQDDGQYLKIDSNYEKGIYFGVGSTKPWFALTEAQSGVGTGTSGKVGNIFFGVDIADEGGTINIGEGAMWIQSASIHPSANITDAGALYNNNGKPTWWDGTTSYDLTATGSGGGSSLWTDKGDSGNGIKYDSGDQNQNYVEINSGTGTNLNTFNADQYRYGNLFVGQNNDFGTAGAGSNYIQSSFGMGTQQIWGGSGTVSYCFSMGAGNEMRDGISSFIIGTNSDNSGSYNALMGQSVVVYGNDNKAIGNGILIGTTSATKDENVGIGANMQLRGADRTTVIGYGVDTNFTTDENTVHFGAHTGNGTRSSMGIFCDPGVSSLQKAANFSMGSINCMRSGTAYPLQSGAGNGIFYMSNGGLAPSINAPNAAALFGSDRTGGASGLLIKAENGGKSWIGDRIGINVTTSGTATALTGDVDASLHIRGEGTTSGTTNLLIEDDNGDELVKITDDGAVYGVPGAMLAMTELTAAALVTHTVATSTTATVINLNSDATTRLAKASFVAPPSGNVLVRIEFDATLTNSATNLRIGLHNANASTTTPTEGWFRVNGDQDGSSASYFAEFKITGLTPGTTYNRYFVASSDFSGVTIRASQQQTGAIAVSDLPSPLRIKTYDLGAISITSNPTS